jgi:hypothetical protein
MKKTEQAAEPSPADAIMRAFDHNEGQLIAEQSKGRSERTKNTDLHLASPYVAVEPELAVVYEGADFFAVYCKLHFSKPLFRKIKYLAQLNDETLIGCIEGMIKQEVAAELESGAELGELVKNRILEQAYGVGKLMPHERAEAMDKAQEDERFLTT